jgi:hypothetical protein
MAAVRTITVSFGRRVTMTGLALDPGFDKTGKNEDRWKENRRISAATFTTDDGSAFTVSFDHRPWTSVSRTDCSPSCSGACRDPHCAGPHRHDGAEPASHLRHDRGSAGCAVLGS